MNKLGREGIKSPAIVAHLCEGHVSISAARENRVLGEAGARTDGSSVVWKNVEACSCL